MPSYFCSTPEVKKESKKVNSKRSRRRLAVGLLGVFLFLVLAYIIQINILTAVGFQIKALERGTAGLNDVTEELELRVASLKELPINREAALKNGYIAVDRAEYLVQEQGGSGIAIRQ